MCTCPNLRFTDDSIFNNEVIPSGYSLYRKDRSSRGGGVLVAVSDSIPSSACSSPVELEVVTVVLQLQQEITLCTVYVPPDAPLVYVQSLCSYLLSLSNTAKALVVVGDFNFPNIRWSSLCGSCTSTRLFCDTIFECNLSQLVEDPTHIKGNLLDLVLVSDDDLLEGLQVHPEDASPFTTDHYLISFCFQRSCEYIPCKSPIIVFDYSKADWDGLSNHLMDNDFSLCFEVNDVEEIWSMIKLVVLSAMHLFIPKVRLRRYQFPRWFSPDLRHKYKCLQTLERRWVRNPSKSNTIKKEEAEMVFRRDAELAKVSYESRLISEFATSNSSMIYKYIGSLKKGKDIPSTVYYGSERASSDEASATLFNRYFHSVFTESNFELPPMKDLPDMCSDMEISDSDVYEVLISLDQTKAKGLDGIGPNLLKSCALALYQPLRHLFVNSIAQHVIPAEWKIHAITPVYKSGDHGSVTNYRPISLLSSTSKVLERLVYRKLIEFLQGSISSVQFGFLKGHSTLQQLLLFYNVILSSSLQWDVIFLDFAKAFDTVPHKELLLKLNRHGVSGNLWLWLECYLTKRFQCVCLGESRSMLLPVVSGVPQGSILGPLLFLIYINDLPVAVKHSLLLLFADDAKLAKLVRNPLDCNQLQGDLDSMCSWSQEWKLLFKETKCVLLRCCRKGVQVNSTYSLSNESIQVRDTHKDLGVMISSDLTFTTHLDYIVGRAYRVLGLLRRTFRMSANVNEKRLLYISLVRSQLMYCSSIWHPYLVKEIVRLERVQRRATKYILNDYRSDYKSRLVSLNLLPLMYILELNDVMFCVKSLQSPTRDFNIRDFITFSSGGTRSSTAMKMAHTRSISNSSRHFYFNRIARLWNSLPPFDLQSSPITIKDHLYVFLWEHFRANFDSNNACTNHFICPCSKCSFYAHPPCF